MQAVIQQASPAPSGDSTDAVFAARITPAEWIFEAPTSLSLLESAELATVPGLKLASSCRNGTCRTCICRLSNGSVGYRIEWPGLSLEEKSDGYILPCVAYPLSDVVIEVPV